MIEVQQDLLFIKKMYNKFKDTNEENIKIHVVTNFLKMLGYDSTEFDYEQQKYFKDGRADIAVKVNNTKSLYIEVKSSQSKLTDKEQSQLADYLFSNSYEWGILTNGREYILFNVKIESIPNSNRPGNLDRVIFNVDIFNKRQSKFIKYYSKENIFDKEITNYFKYISQFKAYRFPDGGSSWNVYKSTLYNFFIYYSDNLKRYRDLNQIRLEEFEDFLLHENEQSNNKEQAKKISSSDTFNNKYSHIRSFFQTLKIKLHSFDENRTELVKRMNLLEEKTIKDDMLNQKNIQIILDYFDSRKEALRNKVIFLLCICFGFERSTLYQLKTDNIVKGKIIIDQRELVIPPKLISLIEELLEQNKNNKVKGTSLLYTKYNNQFRQMSESTINYVFDTLKGIDTENKNWKILNPAYIRTHLIKNLFTMDYSIEEIVYMTGADLNSLSALIEYDHIINKVKARGRKVNKVHPYHSFLY
ncbi:type I restriction enzyme HsdR N-terminal domain-containing protein [Bacillus sp. NPDC077027]|uniref:type I restriction enzyme HsdR N-terminal domain-containing protein n=1 Tax=Bacillus sp. NPDC077027 TaxID=3390548 RepID=UPI003D04BB7D